MTVDDANIEGDLATSEKHCDDELTALLNELKDEDALGSEKASQVETPTITNKRDSKLLEQLKQGLARGEIDVHSALAKRFERDMTREEKQAYATKDNAEKSQFRLAWAQTKKRRS